jgi:pimeloyl-ACP methyl ester carboxylesterase
MIDPVEGEPRELDQGRQIRFAITPTGVRVAYAIVGRGPALIVPAAWIGHLEIAWQDPAVRAFYAPIAACRTVVAYDKPGCGLSDPWPAPQTLDSDLEVLRTVIDHLKLGRVDLLGLSMGAPVSLAYTVQHPEGVGRLILYGGFANGHHVATAKVRTAMIELVRAHWGLGSDVLADIFLPDGTAEMKVRFAELQRRSTTAEVAAELLAQCYEIRVDDLLDRVAAPTLVLHRRDDRAIPYQLGRDLAARIPGAAAGIARRPEPLGVRRRRRGGGPRDPGVPGRLPQRAARRTGCGATCHAHGTAAPGRGPGRQRLHQPADRRPAGDRGTLGRGTRRAYPQAAWREVPRPDRHLVGLRPR